jgi:hypothetical protein
MQLLSPLEIRSTLCETEMSTKELKEGTCERQPNREKRQAAKDKGMVKTLIKIMNIRFKFTKK